MQDDLEYYLVPKCCHVQPFGRLKNPVLGTPWLPLAFQIYSITLTKRVKIF